jgi:hypothetical protein
VDGIRQPCWSTKRDGPKYSTGARFCQTPARCPLGALSPLPWAIQAGTGASLPTGLSLFALWRSLKYNAGTVKSFLALHLRRSLLALAILGVALLPGGGPLSAARADSGRLVLAFYYAWYDQKTWKSGQIPDLPLTPYVSANREAMARQIDQAKGAGIDAFVLNWWGKGNQTEKNLRSLLDIAAQKGFRVAVDFDINSPFMGGVGSYAENLRHLHSVHAGHSAYLRYQGRPVVFFYNVSRYPVATWQRLRDQVDPGRQALWIAEGTDIGYQSVFDGHHLYSITWPNRTPPSQTLPKWGNRIRKYNREQGTSKLWIATVMPGYDDRKVRPGNGFARSRDGGEYYRQCWQAAIASKAQWVIINSFNEWPEGSYIEPSQAYGNRYLDLTREWATRFKEAEVASSSAPLPPPTATPAPQPTATPLPATPVPTLPPTTDLWPSGQACSYVLVETETRDYWVLLCPSSNTATDLPALIY